jgi:hypothetical protein
MAAHAAMMLAAAVHAIAAAMHAMAATMHAMTAAMSVAVSPGCGASCTNGDGGCGCQSDLD